MLTRFLCSSVLLSLATFPVKSMSAQEPPPSGGSCLGVETSDMKTLLERTRFWLSQGGETADRVRARHFEGKRWQPEAVQPVLEEALCAKVMRLVTQKLIDMDSTAAGVAVVRVGGEMYVATFRWFAPRLSRMVGSEFYLDRGLTRVVSARQL